MGKVDRKYGIGTMVFVIIAILELFIAPYLWPTLILLLVIMEIGYKAEKKEENKEEKEARKVLKDNPCSIIDYVNTIQHGKQLLQALTILNPNKVIQVYSKNPVHLLLQFVPNGECYSRVFVPETLMCQRNQVANMADIIIDDYKCSIEVECEFTQPVSAELCSIVDYANVALYGKLFLQSLTVLEPGRDMNIHVKEPTNLSLKSIDGEKSVQVKIPTELISQRDQIAGMTEIIVNDQMRTITAYF